MFYIHPKLREFIGNFHADNDLIELISFNSVPLNQLLMGCSMMITDYSSACWDAYYLEKPILFYQFDLKQYNETNGSYINMEKNCSATAVQSRMNWFISSKNMPKMDFRKNLNMPRCAKIILLISITITARELMSISKARVIKPWLCFI